MRTYKWELYENEAAVSSKEPLTRGEFQTTFERGLRYIADEVAEECLPGGVPVDVTPREPHVLALRVPCEDEVLIVLRPTLHDVADWTREALGESVDVCRGDIGASEYVPDLRHASKNPRVTGVWAPAFVRIAATPARQASRRTLPRCAARPSAWQRRHRAAQLPER